MDPEATSVYLDYSYITSENPDIEEAPSHLPYTSVFLPIFYTAVFLIGVLGNLILMSALHFKRGSQRLIDIFIINLAASDFIFLITLPVCMSVDRYLAIVCPAISRKLRRRDCAYGVCASVWFISCLLGLPTLLSRELTLIDGKPYCAEKKATSIKLTWALVALIFTFFAPLVSMVTCYCCITRKLCVRYQQSGRHNKKLRKSIKIIFIVVAAFVFSWLPFNTFKLLAIVSGLQQELHFSSAFLQWGMEVSGPLAFANSCVNPFIYYIFDSYIRRAIVHCLCPCLKNYDFGSSTETSDLTKALSNFIQGEDFARRRKRSVSL